MYKFTVLLDGYSNTSTALYVGDFSEIELKLRIKQKTKFVLLASIKDSANELSCIIIIISSINFQNKKKSFFVVFFLFI